MNKCEKAGFEHFWENTTPSYVYATDPPQYPPLQRKCRNCGLEQKQHLVQREIIEWKDL